MDISINAHWSDITLKKGCEPMRERVHVTSITPRDWSPLNTCVKHVCCQQRCVISGLSQKVRTKITCDGRAAIFERRCRQNRTSWLPRFPAVITGSYPEERLHGRLDYLLQLPVITANRWHYDSTLTSKSILGSVPSRS